MKAGEMLAQTHPGSRVFLVLSLWIWFKALGAKSTSDVMRNRERPPYCYGRSNPFSSLCCDHLVGAAQCLELSGQRGLCVLIITLCSASDRWCVLVIKLFVSKQKACSALIHRILNLVLSRRNNLLCGTE